MRKFLVGMAATALAMGGITTSSQAVVLFQVEASPGGTHLMLTKAKDASSSTGSVLSTDDVAIAVTGNADFADGFSTIKPSTDVKLTMLTFTPTDANAFDSFSFRGQDLVAGQVIDVIIQDNQGNAPVTLSFTEGNANQDFTRDGIIAALNGETIKSIEISNSGGFKEAKEFEFDQAGVVINPLGGAPEPATWLMLIAGFGLVGAATRYRRINLIKA